MANIINGTDTGSGGLITTGDSSDELQLQTAETTAITINSTQQAIFTAGSASAPAITTTGDTNTGIFFPTADTIAFAEGGVEAARFNSSGNLAFPNGQGIDFSASAGGGASSSILDDYEEGTFTPTVTGVSTAGTTTYSTQLGFYTKIGRQVFVVVDVAYSAATGTGGMKIQMPFAAAPLSGTAGVGSIMTNNLNWTAGTYLTSYLPLNDSNLVIYGSTDDGAVTQQNMTNEAVNLWLSISYIAT